MRYTQLLIIALLIINVACQNFAGDPCVHVKEGTNGTCKSISDCPSAAAGLFSNVTPQTCGFVVKTPIVCCPIKVDIDQIVATTTGAKSIQKCKEYARRVYHTVVSPVLILNETTDTLTACDHKPPVELIVGGQNADSKDFPHMVTLGYDDTEGKRIYSIYTCEGSLISENFVLTAGHCLVSRQYGEAKYVKVGDTDPQEYIVIDRIRHPKYVPKSFYNDIGLLKLDKNIRFSASVRPICLNYETSLRDEKAIARYSVTLGHSDSSQPLKVTLDLYSQDDCNRSFELTRKLARGIDYNTQICAGLRAPENLFGMGNSGGPLQVFSRDQETFCMYKLLGVTSFGKDIERAGFTQVYTRVSHYVPWIENIVWP